jgi:hypothetical protein
VLSAVTNLSLATVNDDEIDPESESVATDATRDVIAHVRSLIRVVRLPSMVSGVYIEHLLPHRSAPHL